ncbi:MAG: transposase [Thermoflexales bacterium]
MELHRHLPKFADGVHFITARTFRGARLFSDDRCARYFCETLEAERERLGYHILAFVVMPNHIHLLLWWSDHWIAQYPWIADGHASGYPSLAPRPELLTISKVMWAVKGKSARRILDDLKARQSHESTGIDGVAEGSALGHPINTLMAARAGADEPHHRNWKYKAWQQGAGYDFNVLSRDKALQKAQYIHQNPVRAGLARRAPDYVWSSAGDYAGTPTTHSVRVSPLSLVF